MKGLFDCSGCARRSRKPSSTLQQVPSTSPGAQAPLEGGVSPNYAGKMHLKLSCGMKFPSCGRGRCYGLADKRSGSSSFMRVPSTRLPLVLMAVIGCSLLSTVTARSLNVNVHSRALKQQQLQGPIAATATEAAPTSGSRSSNATAASWHPEARAADLKAAVPTDPAAATAAATQQVSPTAATAAAAAASTPDPNAPWNQRRTLQLPPHVYLISFIMLLVIMAALLSCHCYRMCRIARRMRQAAELGVTVSGAGSALCKRTPQAIIEALPVTKYASISSLRAGSSFSMKGPWPATAAAAAAACNAGGGDGAAAAAAAASSTASTAAASTAVAPGAPRRLPLLEAAVQLKEQIIRQTGISASRTSRRPSASSSHLGAAGTSSSAMAAGRGSTAITNECGASSAAGGGSSSSQQLPLQVEIVAVTAEPPATGNQDGEQMPGVGGSSSGDYAAAPAVAAAAALPVSTAAAAVALLNRQKQAPAGHNSSSSSSGGEPCAICFEDFAPDDDVKQLPCAHFYHCGCIDEWLVRDVTCPLCKAPVLDKDLLEQQQRAAAALEANFAHLGMAVRRRQQQQRDQDRQQQRQQQRQQRRHERRQQRRDRWLRRSTPPLGLGRPLPSESFVLPAGTAAADPTGAVGGSSSSASGTGAEQAASAEAAASGPFTQQQQQQQQQEDGRLQRLRRHSSSSSSSSPSAVRELLELATQAMMRFPGARHPHSAAPRQQQQQPAAAAGAGSSATDVEMGEARR